MTSPPDAMSGPTEHRDSLPEDVEIDVTRLSVRIFQRVAAQMVARQDLHAAEVRKFARALATEYRAECERQARAASLEEFRGWLSRRGDLVRQRSRPVAHDPRRHDWRTTS